MKFPSPLLLLLATTLFPFPAKAEPPKKPNIVFLFSDDHSLQTIGACDARLSGFCREQNITPNIDRLAEQGGLFTNSFCANSLCAPSRASVLTGLHSHANGVMTIIGQPPISKETWTFPQGLREAGYVTCLIGKWHLEKTTPPLAIGSSFRVRENISTRTSKAPKAPSSGQKDTSPTSSPTWPWNG